MIKFIINWIALGICFSNGAGLAGPGLGNITFPDSIFTNTGNVISLPIIGRIGGNADSMNAAPGLHTTAIMHDGYLVLPCGGELQDAGFSFFDISNPYNPVHKKLVLNKNSRESHSIGLSYSYPGMMAVTQGTYGILFWDWTDIQNPLIVSELVLPGIGPNVYDNGVFWLFWQAPYVYVSGMDKGLFIVDASDPGSPVLVNSLSQSQLGGFKAGSVNVVGNLMVITATDQRGISIFDISDPKNPILTSTSQHADHYSSLINGEKLYTMVELRSIWSYDISDPHEIKPLQYFGAPFSTTKGGYGMIQDNFIHTGQSSWYYKIDVSNDSIYTEVGRSRFEEDLNSYDLDFISVVGNLVIMGDDSPTYQGSRIVAHQKGPDTLGPLVNMVNPKADAAMQSLLTRIGLTFTDQIDLRSVDNSSFIVRPMGGSPLKGKYSGQLGILNFWPDSILDTNTVYEVLVPAGSIKDYAGNTANTDFYSTFRTTIQPLSIAKREKLQLEDVFSVSPNPFNPSTTLSFSVPFSPGRQHQLEKEIRIFIYNSNGKIIKSFRSTTQRTFKWNAGQTPSGIFMIRAFWGNKVFFKTAVLGK